MIPVETVIRKLIVDYEFVILPGFGALLSHQVSVCYDKESGVFSPPDKRLAFNESLKLDDGLLANYISRHEKIAHIEAVAYVRRYTEKLRSVLQQTGEAQIQGIGRFNNNVEGKLVFDPTDTKYFRDEWYGFRNFQARTISAQPVFNAASKHEAIEEDVEILGNRRIRSKRIGWVKWASAAMLIGLVCYFSLFFMSGRSENMSTLNPFPNLFESANSPTRVVELNENTGKAIDKVKPVAAVLVEKPAAAAISESASAAELPIAREVPEIALEAKFYVIAGAFKGMKQANILLGQLKEKGFTEAKILPADRYSTKVKVAVNAYALETDAYRASSKLKNVIGEPGWVFKIR